MERRPRLHRTPVAAAPRGPSVRAQLDRTSWTAVADRRARLVHRSDPARDVQALVPSRARNPALRGPGAARRSRLPLAAQRTPESHPDRARNHRAAAYAPRARSHPSARGPRTLDR